MDPITIIQKYYKQNSKLYNSLIKHSKAVSKKALEIANNVPELNPDLKFIEEASMLHDIGIFLTKAPEIYCTGDKSYICHGYLGREILEKENLPKHALVCERHVGVGLTEEDIEIQKLPIPKRNMQPTSIEEEIICFADKFFSKTDENLSKPKNIKDIQKELSKYGDDKVAKFNYWIKKFKLEN